MQTVWLAFLTGLTTGGLSCLAVQGGLLTSAIAQHNKSEGKKIAFLFLVSKLAVYTILGFGLGMLGSVLTLSTQVTAILQIFAGLFMVLTALQLLDVHPILRYLVIQPPRWAYKLAFKESEDKSWFSPLILGALTVLIPCGTTQAMMALAIASGNAFYGAAILLAFVLGTSPVFFALGLAASKLLKKKAFVYITSLVIVTLGITAINTGQVLRGSPHTLQNYYKAIAGNTPKTVQAAAPINENGQQEVTINVYSTSYKSSFQTLKAGVPVRLTLKTNQTYGCSRAFVIPSQNISQVLPETGDTVVEFTPSKTGPLTYTCSMGMYSGSFTVVN
jgi:uncharacterized protein